MKVLDLWSPKPHSPSLKIEQIISYQRHKFQVYRQILCERYRQILRSDQGLILSALDIKPTELDQRLFLIGQVQRIVQSQKTKRVTIVDPQNMMTLSLIKDRCQGNLDLVQGSIVGFIVMVKSNFKTSKAPSERSLLGDLVSSLNPSVQYLCQRVVYPCFRSRNQDHRSPCSKGVAIISDIHVGSYTFIESNFLSLIDTLNQDKTVGYLLVAGDTIDGNGVYPGQVADLKIPTLREQYEHLGLILGSLRPDIQVIMAMGNHDGYRRQPQYWSPQAKEILTRYNPHITFISNPGYVRIQEYNFLVYHGASADPLIARCPNLSYQDPCSIGQFLMRYRNLCPCSDRIPIVPTTQLYHLVPQDMDYLVTGHIHKRGIRQVQGRWCLSAGTWQHLTPFQQRVGFDPDYCVLDIVYPGNQGLNKYLDLKDQRTDDYVHRALR